MNEERAAPRPDSPAEPDSQAAVVAFMSDAARQGVDAVRHIETHISHIFLIGDHAYKMKKAVRLDFVDFSTLAARARACREELVVNGRTAPDIYLSVEAVTRGPGGLRLGGTGEAVEHLVKMRRFEQDAILDRIVAEGRLTPDVARAVADAAAGLHLSAARAEPGEAEPFARTVGDLGERLVRAAAGTPLVDEAARWRDMAQADVAARAPRLAARARRGAVRHGHGDLHLRNICLFRGEVRLFDAIEFEPRFSHIDVLYDLAFLLMDLKHRDADAAATAILSRYLAATRDYRGVEDLRLFVSTRAAVRALVSLLSPEPDDKAEAAEYLSLAAEALSRRPRPALIAVGGRSGTGKSTLAAALAPTLAPAPNVVSIRSDEARKRMFGLAPEARLPVSAYVSDVGARVYRRILRDAARALRGGAVVALDAAFLEDDRRAAAEDVAKAAGAPFVGLWLSAPDAVLEARVAARRGDASDADVAVLRRQKEPEALGGWTRLDAYAPLDRLVGEARSALARLDG